MKKKIDRLTQENDRLRQKVVALETLAVMLIQRQSELAQHLADLCDDCSIKDEADRMKSALEVIQ